MWPDRAAGAAIHTVLRRWGAVEKTSYDDFYIDVTTLCDRSGTDEVDAEDGTTCDAESATERECDAGRRPARTRVWGDADFATLGLDLRRGCCEASAMRRALLLELGLVGSAGVGRSKLVARMLSPAAKPDGVLVVRDEDAQSMMCSQPLTSLPGYQAKRGREIASLVAKALGRSPTATPAAPVTVGDVISIDGAELVRTIGATDAERLRRAVSSGDARGHGGSGVAERPLPRRLVAEESFPPTARTEAVQVGAVEIFGSRSSAPPAL